MKSKLSDIKNHLTFSNVIAVLALFIALGGVSYAAVNLPKNSVGSKQIKNNAVNSSKVKNRSLLANDFKLGQLPRGAVGPTGAVGTDGQNGVTGTSGQDGITGQTGETGQTGATGLMGTTGPEGTIGPTGLEGGTGPTGTTGATGDAGVSSAAVMSAHTQSAISGPSYFAISGITDQAAGTKTDAVSISPAVAVTARNLAVRGPNNFSPGSSYTVSLMDDGIAVLACTANFAGLSTPSTCQDTSSAAAISPGSELVLLGTNSNLSGAKVDVAFTIGP